MASDNQQPLRVALIGGGIGGLSTLLGLLHHTSPTVIQTHLYEAAAKFSEIGAGVAFGPNAVQAMGIVDPDLQTAYFSIAAKAEPIIVNGRERVEWHKFLTGMKARSERCGLEELVEIPGATPYSDNKTFNVHRATFLEEMLELLKRKDARGNVSFNKRCNDIEVRKEGGVTLRFADGTTEEADCVIGCDGVKSKVRPILMRLVGDDNSKIEPRFTGKYAYRGLIPMEDAVDALGEVAKINLMICGYGGHLVTFPINKGKIFNVVAFQSPKNEGKTWEHGDDWIIPATVEDAQKDFEGWSEPVKKLLGMLQKPDKWALFDHPPCSTYHFQGTVAMLGDCAHASTPHQGAGAGMAIEDAAFLTSLFGTLKTPDRSQLAGLFEVYDKSRRERTQKLVKTSRECGFVYDFEAPSIGDDTAKFADNTHQRYDWIWRFDVEKGCDEAIAMLPSQTQRANL